MTNLFVSDTTTIICYFNDIFNQSTTISDEAIGIIHSALSGNDSDTRLSIPAVVFLEIFEKWFWNEELASKFYYEAFLKIKESPNIEIKPIDYEVLENLLRIGDNLIHHEINDKIILASAMMLNCPLLTTDQEITKFVSRNKVIPRVIS